MPKNDQHSGNNVKPDAAIDPAHGLAADAQRLANESGLVMQDNGKNHGDRAHGQGPDTRGIQ